MKKLLFMVAVWTVSAAATFGQNKSVVIYRNGNMAYYEFTSQIDSIIFINKPAAPTGVTAVLSSNTAITVTWNASEGAASYEVYRSGNNFAYSSLTTVSGTTYTDNMPLAGQNYYKVKAKIINLESALSDASTAVTYDGGGTYNVNDAIAFRMIVVPGGTTTLNSTEVTLSDFWIGQYEVTQRLWTEVMGSCSTDSATGIGIYYPVYNVSWDDIVGTGSTTGYTVNGVAYKTNGFCYKLSQLIGGSLKFCLPTEAQWEYAAKGGQQTHNYVYSGSDAFDDVAWHGGNSGYAKGITPYSHIVGTKSANELGIYDMSGNVWEWCSDWNSSTYPSGTNNPTGPTIGSEHVFRGGSWFVGGYDSRVSNRSGANGGSRFVFTGFRVALVP